MFKKFKDKITEEVKSSPQRIQQFAQAAQAAVTSASSSISDVTHNDLFSIGDNDCHQRYITSSTNQKSPFHELAQQQSQHTSTETLESSFTHEETSRQRRLSNSSFASDISFRLPTYESPSMYHLQSDMDISASEAEEKGFCGGSVNLDRVTKEQLYAAYKRTQDRCTKYKTQYADLARHYKFLERENAKARNVLVETQDKALRRISELKEQSILEQSAKAHLEKALRVEIEEKNIKIEVLNKKLNILQDNKDDKYILDSGNKDSEQNDNNSQLIDFSPDDKQDFLQSEMTLLNNKITKMEQLINKYKESLKVSKEKNAQLITEAQILSSDLENKNKEIALLNEADKTLKDTYNKIDELNDTIEKMQNNYKALEFSKNKEISILRIELVQTQEEILQLNSKVEGLSKREEEYAISLAENKLSIHKELETKETEIKSLKDSLTISQNEIQSLNIVISDYKKNVLLLEEERSKYINNINELNKTTFKIKDLELQLEDLTKKFQYIETCKVKLEEEYKCLELQLKQETAEKLAMIDRNNYLENRNSQLSEECLKKNTQINTLERDIKLLAQKEDSRINCTAENEKLIADVDKWKIRYIQLETEIQEEREELVKLQTEIEKLLNNHESVQTENISLRAENKELEKKRQVLQVENENVKSVHKSLLNKVKTLQQNIYGIKQEIKLSVNEICNGIKANVNEKLYFIISRVLKQAEEKNDNIKSTINSLEIDLKCVTESYESKIVELQEQIKQYEDLEHKQQENKDYDILKKTLSKNLQDHNILLKEKQNLCDTLKIELESKKDSTENIKKLERENSALVDKIENIEKNNLRLKTENDKLKNEIKNFEEIQSTLEINNQNIMEMVETYKSVKLNEETKNKSLLEKYNDLHNENENLLKKLNENEIEIKRLQTENEKLHNKKINLNIPNDEPLYKISLHHMTDSKNNAINEKLAILENTKIALKSQNKNLETEVHELKSNFSTIATENEKLHRKLKEIMDQNAALECENKTYLKELDVIKDSNVYLQEKVNIIKKQTEDYEISLKDISRKNDSLKKKLEDYDINVLHCQELEKEIIVLKTENETLKSQYGAISNNVKDLKIEMVQVHNSHEEVDKEKDHLSVILRNFENHEPKHDSGILNTQSHGHNLSAEVIGKITLQDLTDKSTQAIVDQDYKVNETVDFSNINAINLETRSIQHENALLKEENRRLHSDIEGLQTYLTKISKENSHLNEKLREIITSNDNFSEQYELSQYDTQTLKNEIQSGKDKIDNLTRENTLLLEENLELKDQIHCPSFNKSIQLEELKDKDNSVNDIDHKYINLLNNKINLEKRIHDLEYLNLSIGNNMQEMEQNNEKLRLANDKLGRRLDEALVSLRHLHSLQENTELEYLRNILYEYLTGSGTHSLTLAKVLSAVVKFNESQTEIVLQKEKERQGVLRQLGII